MSTVLENVDDVDLGECEDWGERRVQTNGEATIPQAMRERHGIEPGDKILFKDLGDGFLLIQRPG